KLAMEFLAELGKLHERQQQLTQPDPLLHRIDSLFDGRVGDAPPNQKAVDDLYAEAEKRFKLGIPPGYRDAGKEKTEEEQYVGAGILYKRKFGDFLVWRQTLEHAKQRGMTHLIFLTDDAKDDWWQLID